jgi:hypothetical protein
MKKNVWIFGVISGLIISLWMICSVSFCTNNTDFESSELLGYASMLLSFSLIFVAIKNYRDKFNNGVVSFGKAFMIGLYISLIASTIYVISWLIDYHFFVPDFMDTYSAHMLDKLKASGASVAEIEKKTTEMASFKEMYKNPFFNIALTYSEILPVGLVVSLISAAILKKKNVNS